MLVTIGPTRAKNSLLDSCLVASIEKCFTSNSVVPFTRVECCTMPSNQQTTILEYRYNIRRRFRNSKSIMITLAVKIKLIQSTLVMKRVGIRSRIRW